ncbi:MAG: fructose-bisphosphate aldolase class I [Candidatus Nomurabacteria bacterium]|nr:fructose-bisphosphate aldolase class I [Candidatus Nomurabacteria bacterium]
MNEEILIETIKRLMVSPKGLLAIDESLRTCNSRFEKLGVQTTEEKRREYRELLITAPDIEKYISGYILFDETIRQSTADGKSFISVLQSKGIEVGIKVDGGLSDFPEHTGEKITEGLEGLEDRLKEHKKLGATFAKWRAVYTIGEKTPSLDCMKENAKLFAKYAELCQKNNLVPIVEPEVLIEGDHTMEECYQAIARNLEVVFNELKLADIFFPGMILKTSMVLPGNDAKVAVYNQEIAQSTIKCLKEKVPNEIGGIVFLSGGQKDEEATKNLNEMKNLGPLPWPLTFSYGRAIQNEAMEAWAKNPEDIAEAQRLLLLSAENNSLASVGKYKSS